MLGWRRSRKPKLEFQQRHSLTRILYPSPHLPHTPGLSSWRKSGLLRSYRWAGTRHIWSLVSFFVNLLRHGAQYKPGMNAKNALTRYRAEFSNAIKLGLGLSAAIRLHMTRVAFVSFPSRMAPLTNLCTQARSMARLQVQLTYTPSSAFSLIAHPLLV